MFSSHKSVSFVFMLFTPVKIGPLTLRNRSIRAAAFEGMSKNHNVSGELIAYHRQVAAGGIGMTTVAYASVTKDGLSFPHQLWLRDEIVPQLKKLTDSVHEQGALASIQIGHCGNMAKKSVTGFRPVAPDSCFNMYGPSWPRALSLNEINDLVKSFGKAVRLAQRSGFDAVEIHAGHGYLISQFLSPYTNHRYDEFGGSLLNRMRFLKMVIDEVIKQADGNMAVLVKMNMRDGFKGGMELDESLQVAKMLEQAGVHALVLSGGFVSKAPMYILRGAMPLLTLATGMKNKAMSVMVKLFGKYLIKTVPFNENYFLNDAMIFRKEIGMPLIYVGGILARSNIEQALSYGFDAVAMARALIQDPAFINKLRNQEINHSSCNTCNYCIAVMYNGSVRCNQSVNQPIAC